ITLSGCTTSSSEPIAAGVSLQAADSSPAVTTSFAPPVPAATPPPATPPARVAATDPYAEVSRGDPDKPLIALVFNVGAGHTPAPAILNSVAEKEYRASFFVLGWWADRHPDQLAQINAAGHEIASHGHSVFDLRAVSDDEVRADLEAADASISA